jgi:hypothetical protein
MVSRSVVYAAIDTERDYQEFTVEDVRPNPALCKDADSVLQCNSEEVHHGC